MMGCKLIYASCFKCTLKYGGFFTVYHVFTLDVVNYHTLGHLKYLKKELRKKCYCSFINVYFSIYSWEHSTLCKCPRFTDWPIFGYIQTIAYSLVGMMRHQSVSHKCKFFIIVVKFRRNFYLSLSTSVFHFIDIFINWCGLKFNHKHLSHLF